MSGVMKVELLLPELSVQVGNLVFPMSREGKHYEIKEQLAQGIETDNILFLYWNEVFDIEDRRIALRAGDTLHIEYNLNVYEDTRERLSS